MPGLANPAHFGAEGFNNFADVLNGWNLPWGESFVGVGIGHGEAMGGGDGGGFMIESFSLGRNCGEVFGRNEGRDDRNGWDRRDRIGERLRRLTIYD